MQHSEKHVSLKSALGGFEKPVNVKVEPDANKTSGNAAKKPRLEPNDSQVIAPILSKDHSIMLLLKCAALKDNMSMWR